MEKTICKLIPLTGMEWKGQLIRFGDSRELVDQMLGKPDNIRDNVGYYCGTQLRVEFDEGGRAKFMECLAGIDGSIQPEIYGVLAFETDAEELLEILKQENDGPVYDQENGYSYAFLNSGVGIYREITPEAVEEMVRELMNVELTALGHIDLESENRRANHWETIGIGKKDYYAHLR